MDVLYVNLAEDQAEEGVLDFVRALSRQIGLTGQSILRAEEAAKRHLLDQQLTMARDIQLSLIPKSLNFSPRVDLALTYEPALWVGGDYCDVWPLADGRIAFALGDVSGKGLPAAMMMANLQAALRTAIHFRSDLAEAMAYLNQHLKRYTPAEAFVTMVTGLLDPATGRLEYLNAGHPLPLLVSASASISALGEPRNLPLGMVEATFTQDEAVLQPGTRLVLVTDGVTDALSPGGEKFGSPRLQEVLSRGATNSSRNVVDAVARAVEEFRGARPPQDDVTILAVLNRGGA
jgi:sigma-B regulation protein RsbU (phosphoserine phosphatase)